MHPDASTLTFETRGVRLVVRRQRDGLSWRCGSAFCITPVGGDGQGGSWHLKYLRKTRRLSGTDVLDVAERCCRALAGERLSLQDQATVHCKKTGSYDMAFLSQMTSGKTWYERRGYAISEGARHVRSGERWMQAYRRIPVRRLAHAVEMQVSRLADADSYRRNGGQRWEPMDEIEPLTWAFSSATEAQKRRSSRFLESELPWLLWHRRRLLRLLRSAPEDATLGTWLPTLACQQYAGFMLDAYGALQDGRSPAIFRHDGAGGVMPSVKEFVGANAARRWAWKITFTKDLRT